MPSLHSHLFRFLIRRMTGSLNHIPPERWNEVSVRGKPYVPKGVTRRAETVGGVPCEWLVPDHAAEERTLLYLHGGGWVLGWGNSHRRMVSQLASACRARALAVDYRLAPQHPFPAAVDDCAAVYRALLQQGNQPESIIIAGDSAGGNLALAALLALKESGDPLPAAGVTLSAATDMAFNRPSHETNRRKEASLPPRLVEYIGQAYLAGVDKAHPLLSPIYGDLAGLPPLLMQAGGDEILLSDTTCFAEKAQAAGVNVTVSVYPGMWHVWQIFYPYLPEARRAVEEIARFTDRIWSQHGF